MKVPDPGSSGVPPRLADEMKQRLQESLRKRRPQTFWITLAVLAVAIAVLAGSAYWLYPRPDPPRLEILGMDQIAPFGNEGKLVAGVTALTDSPDRWFLRNQKIRGYQTGGAQVNAESSTFDLLTDANGIAEKTISVPKQMGFLEFHVQHVPSKGNAGTFAKTRTFFWDKTPHLLVVEADTTLAELGERKWEVTHPASILIDPEAAKFLASLDGRRIVYLIQDQNDLRHFRFVRNWLEVAFSGSMRSTLPVGPVLGWPDPTSEASAEKVRVEILRQLKERFADNVVVIGKSPALLKAARAVTVASLCIGCEQPADVGAIGVKDWTEVAKHLK